jgi:hypothetical protein
MKTLLRLLPLSSAALVAAFLLGGCTDPKAPKAPPKVPEPKASMTAAPAAQHALLRLDTLAA